MSGGSPASPPEAFQPDRFEPGGLPVDAEGDVTDVPVKLILNSMSDYSLWVEGISATCMNTTEARTMVGRDSLSVYKEVTRRMEERCKPKNLVVYFNVKLEIGAKAERKERNNSVTVLAHNLSSATTEAINLAIMHCRYPEDVTAPGIERAFLPILMSRRCGNILLHGPKYKDYPSMLADLKMVAESWKQLLPTDELVLMWFFKAECELQLQQFADAHQSLAQMNEVLRKASDKTKKSLRVLQEQARGLIKAEGAKQGNLEHPKDKTAPKDIKILPNHPAFPALDSRLDVKMLPRRGKLTGKNQYSTGRGVVAAEPILCGEIIALEKPLLQRTTGTFPASFYCHHCLKHTSFLLPCHRCSVVMFCSRDCLKAAERSYHFYECLAGLTILGFGEKSYNINKVILPAVRMILSHPVSYFRENKEKFKYLSEERRNLDSISEKSRYMSDDHSCFWDLLHKTDFDSSFFSKESTRGCMQAVGLFVMARHVIEILELCKYKIKKKDEDLMVSVALHAVGTCRHNVKTLASPKATIIDNPDTVTRGLVSSNGLEYKEVGSGVFATLSLFNHSCVPNCVLLHLGGQVAVVAQRPLKPGEELTVSYVGSLAQRYIKELPGYHGFECDCLGCEKKWGEPTRRILTPDLFEKLRDICVDPHFLGDLEVEQEQIVRKELGQALGPKRVFVQKLQRCLGEEEFIQTTSFAENLFKGYLIHRHWSRLTWDVEEEVKKVEEKKNKKPNELRV